MKIKPPVSYILLLIFIISVGINLFGYYMNQKYNALQEKNIQLRERVETLDAAWAVCANNLARCRELRSNSTDTTNNMIRIRP